MIEAIEEHPGFLRITDARHENHIVAASVIATVCEAGPSTSFLTYRGGRTPIFVVEPVHVVKAEVARAKALRRVRPTKDRRQMEFDFGAKREASSRDAADKEKEKAAVLATSPNLQPCKERDS